MQRRRTKIVATLGPSTLTKSAIEALAHEGVDVFRINMSHADHAMLQELANKIRDIGKNLDRHMATLVDLQGPKLRIGDISGAPLVLEKGDELRLCSRPVQDNEKCVFLPHPEIFAAIKEGHRLLLDDGKLELTAVSVGPFDMVTRVRHSGKLSGKKGISLPDTRLPVSALTAKDRADLDAALECGADWIALSFVQCAEDVEEVQRLVRKRAAILSKIEKPQALDDLDDIIRLSDAIMVARGDLGVEMPLEEVPLLQKQIVDRARHIGRPVVVATQMLESMISAPVPTRAEVSDVSSAIMDGADAVMLSAESAAGSFPVEAVQTMRKIACATESRMDYRSALARHNTAAIPKSASALSSAARQVAQTLGAAAIATYTVSGQTALYMARERPAQPILALTPSDSIARMLALAWGVFPHVCPSPPGGDQLAPHAIAAALQRQFASPGDFLAITAGLPLDTRGGTNLLRIAEVG